MTPDPFPPPPIGVYTFFAPGPGTIVTGFSLIGGMVFSGVGLATNAVADAYRDEAARLQSQIDNINMQIAQNQGTLNALEIQKKILNGLPQHEYTMTYGKQFLSGKGTLTQVGFKMDRVGKWYRCDGCSETLYDQYEKMFLPN